MTLNELRQYITSKGTTNHLAMKERTYICIFYFREKMARAYDFALEKMGMEIMSYQMWVDYIKFLKSV